MCRQTDAELVAQASPRDRGKRLRVRAFMVYDEPLEADDLMDSEVARLMDAYEIPALALLLRQADRITTTSH